MKIVIGICNRIVGVLLYTLYSVYEILRTIVMWVAHMCDIVAYGKTGEVTELFTKAFDDLYAIIFKKKTK